MILLRQLLGDVLRRMRVRQGRTLREVSASARVSLGYLSEVERGRKEASSEVLEAVCAALHCRLADLFFEVAETLAAAEAVPVAAIGFLPPRPRAAAPAPVPAAAPMAPVLDLRAFAGRRTA